MPNIIGPHGVRRRFLVRVYHRGTHVSDEPILAHDVRHAHQIGQYIASTVARDAIHPREYDRSRVHFQVHDPRDSGAAQRDIAAPQQGTVKLSRLRRLCLP